MSVFGGKLAGLGLAIFFNFSASEWDGHYPSRIHQTPATLLIELTTGQAVLYAFNFKISLEVSRSARAKRSRGRDIAHAP